MVPEVPMHRNVLWNEYIQDASQKKSSFPGAAFKRLCFCHLNRMHTRYKSNGKQLSSSSFSLEAACKPICFCPLNCEYAWCKSKGSNSQHHICRKPKSLHTCIKCNTRTLTWRSTLGWRQRSYAFESKKGHVKTSGDKWMRSAPDRLHCLYHTKKRPARTTFTCQSLDCLFSGPLHPNTKRSSCTHAVRRNTSKCVWSYSHTSLRSSFGIASSKRTDCWTKAILSRTSFSLQVHTYTRFFYTPVLEKGWLGTSKAKHVKKFHFFIRSLNNTKQNSRTKLPIFCSELELRNADPKYSSSWNDTMALGTYHETVQKRDRTHIPIPV